MRLSPTQQDWWGRAGGGSLHRVGSPTPEAQPGPYVAAAAQDKALDVLPKSEEEPEAAAQALSVRQQIAVRILWGRGFEGRRS